MVEMTWILADICLGVAFNKEQFKAHTLKSAIKGPELVKCKTNQMKNPTP